MLSRMHQFFGNRQLGRLQRLAEIPVLQKHIGTYSKTLEVYWQYRDSGWSKKFYADHEAAITAHKAATEFFDD